MIIAIPQNMTASCNPPRSPTGLEASFEPESRDETGQNDSCIVNDGSGRTNLPKPERNV